MNDTDLNLNAKVEEAFKAILEADPSIYTTDDQATSRRLNVKTGITADDQTLPTVFFACNGGPEDPLGSGNYMMEGDLTVKSRIADGIESHNKNVGAVRKSILTSDLDSRLSDAVTDFHVQTNGIWAEQCAESIDGVFAVWTQHFRLICCAATLT